MDNGELGAQLAINADLDATQTHEGNGNHNHNAAGSASPGMSASAITLTSTVTRHAVHGAGKVSKRLMNIPLNSNAEARSKIGLAEDADRSFLPEWEDDDDASACYSCEASFNALRRKHHCRNCGGIFCQNCSNNKMPLPRLGYVRPVRVCNACFGIEQHSRLAKSRDNTRVVKSRNNLLGKAKTNSSQNLRADKQQQQSAKHQQQQQSNWRSRTGPTRWTADSSSADSRQLQRADNTTSKRVVTAPPTTTNTPSGTPSSSTVQDNPSSNSRLMPPILFNTVSSAIRSKDRAKLVLRIFSYLSIEDLCLGAGLVCRYWQTLSSYDYIWSPLYLNYWGSMSMDVEAGSSKDQFRLRKILGKTPTNNNRVNRGEDTALSATNVPSAGPEANWSAFFRADPRGRKTATEKGKAVEYEIGRSSTESDISLITNHFDLAKQQQRASADRVPLLRRTSFLADSRRARPLSAPDQASIGAEVPTNAAGSVTENPKESEESGESSGEADKPQISEERKDSDSPPPLEEDNTASPSNSELRRSKRANKPPAAWRASVLSRPVQPTDDSASPNASPNTLTLGTKRAPPPIPPRKRKPVGGGTEPEWYDADTEALVASLAGTFLQDARKPRRTEPSASGESQQDQPQSTTLSTDSTSDNNQQTDEVPVTKNLLALSSELSPMPSTFLSDIAVTSMARKRTNRRCQVWQLDKRPASRPKRATGLLSAPGALNNSQTTSLASPPADNMPLSPPASPQMPHMDAEPAQERESASDGEMLSDTDSAQSGTNSEVLLSEEDLVQEEPPMDIDYTTRVYDEAKVIKVQATCRVWLAKQVILNMLKKEQYRCNIVKELLSTEVSYVTSLKSIIESYKIPLQSEKVKLMSEEELELLFSNTNELCQFHDVHLLGPLVEVLDNWTPASVVSHVFLDLFSSSGQFLGLYKQYGSTFDKGQALLTTLVTKRSGFADFLDTHGAEQVAKGKLGLQTLLITPIQRVPRYSLLLNDLQRHTAPDHPDHTHLTVALRLMRDLTASIDNNCSSSSSINKLTQIQHRLNNSSLALVQPHRRFVKEGAISVTKHARQGKKPGYLFLFNDCLLLATRRLFGYSCDAMLDLEDLFVFDSIYEDGVPVVSEQERQSLFYLKESDKVYCILTRAKAEKSAWIESINATKAELMDVRNATRYAKQHQLKRNLSGIIVTPNSPSLSAAVIHSARQQHQTAIVSERPVSPPPSSNAQSPTSPSNISKKRERAKSEDIQKPITSEQDLYDTTDTSSTRKRHSRVDSIDQYATNPSAAGEAGDTATTSSESALRSRRGVNVVSSNQVPTIPVLNDPAAVAESEDATTPPTSESPPIGNVSNSNEEKDAQKEDGVVPVESEKEKEETEGAIEEDEGNDSEQQVKLLSASLTAAGSALRRSRRGD